METIVRHEAAVIANAVGRHPALAKMMIKVVASLVVVDHLLLQLLLRLLEDMQRIAQLRMTLTLITAARSSIPMVGQFMVVGG